MWITGAVGVILLVAGIAQKRIEYVLLGLPSVALNVYLKVEERKGVQFLIWLDANRQALVQGAPVSYHGLPITSTSVMTRYEAWVSFLFGFDEAGPWWRSVLSSYYAQGQKAQVVAAIIYSLTSLLFGWLAVFSVGRLVRAIVRNVRGGHKETVSELLVLMHQADKGEPGR